MLKFVRIVFTEAVFVGKVFVKIVLVGTVFVEIVFVTSVILSHITTESPVILSNIYQFSKHVYEEFKHNFFHIHDALFDF